MLKQAGRGQGMQSEDWVVYGQDVHRTAGCEDKKGWPIGCACRVGQLY